MMKLRPGKKKFRIESKKLFLYVQNKLGLSVYCYNKVAVWDRNIKVNWL